MSNEYVGGAMGEAYVVVNGSVYLMGPVLVRYEPDGTVRAVLGGRHPNPELQPSTLANIIRRMGVQPICDLYTGVPP
ncbi:MAG: hypothetical protein N3E38_00035 [Candidatus Aenigmarchaeota archaeon]|nr:hypothetical protein [Candidatus Aenigmarchaeota archaeon]